MLLFLTNLGMGGGPVSEPVQEQVGGFVPVERRYILPNGMNVTATPEEVAAMLARLSMDAAQVQSTPADMADLRDALVSTLRSRPTIPSQWDAELAAREAFRRDEDEAIIAILLTY